MAVSLIKAGQREYIYISVSERLIPKLMHLYTLPHVFGTQLRCLRSSSQLMSTADNIRKGGGII